MTRQFLMITTAIMALATAPAVHAAGTKSTGATTMTTSGKAHAAKADTMKTKPMTSASTKAKDMKAKDAKAMRGQNAQEAEITRSLNRDSAAGRQQVGQTTMPGQTPVQGAMMPTLSDDVSKGASGPGNTGDNPTSNK